MDEKLSDSSIQHLIDFLCLHWSLEGHRRVAKQRISKLQEYSVDTLQLFQTILTCIIRIQKNR